MPAGSVLAIGLSVHVSKYRVREISPDRRLRCSSASNRSLRFLLRSMDELLTPKCMTQPSRREWGDHREIYPGAAQAFDEIERSQSHRATGEQRHPSPVWNR